MEAILSAGRSIIQGISPIINPVLTVIMLAITNLGSEYFYLLALPIVFWCIDQKLGIRLAIVSLLSAFVNGRIKEIVMEGRPFTVDKTLLITNKQPWVPESLLGMDTWSFPSGHAQGTASFWLALALLFKKKWLMICAFALPLVIGFSRIYFGVHYPTDVLAGWILGYGIVLLFVWLEPFISKTMNMAPSKIVIAAFALVVVVMNAIAINTASNATFITSTFVEPDVQSGALLFGILAGYMLMKKHVRFSTKGTLLQQVLKVVLGLGVALAIRYGLKMVLPQFGSDLFLLSNFVRYLLIGFWISLGAPWVFVKLKLSLATDIKEGISY